LSNIGFFRFGDPHSSAVARPKLSSGGVYQSGKLAGPAPALRYIVQEIANGGTLARGALGGSAVIRQDKQMFEYQHFLTLEVSAPLCSNA